MTFAKLTIIQPGHASWELEIGDELVSIGRALDNTICLESDTNVSRYHAEIEKRGESFWVADLSSSNGTTVNDERVEIERELSDGALIGIGGSTLIELHLSDTPWRHQQVGYTSKPANAPEAARADSISHSPALTAPNVPYPATPTFPSPASPSIPNPAISAGVQQVALVTPSSGGPSTALVLAGIGGGLALTALVAILIFSTRSGECKPSVRIVSPQTGITVRGPLAIQVEVEGAKCIEAVTYQIDGNEVAKAETGPYDVILDPERVRGLGRGNHILSVTVEDQQGNKTISQDTVLLAFEGAGSGQETNNDAAGSGQADTQPTPTITQTGPIDVGAMADRLAGQISRKSGYSFDRDFVNLIRIRTNEYRLSGFSDRALPYRREINKAFRDQGLDPLLGYVLAMSRSKFNANANGAGVGLWQTPLSVAQSQGYLQSGESEFTLKDPKRSAEIAAAYSKALISTFESTDDFMYAVACFGDPLGEAGQMRTRMATLSPDPIARRDFFKMVKSGVVKGEQVDRVVRFFAAGIVGENPQAFGLNTEKPFSSLF